MENIIVFITTYNRSSELKNTLESLCSDKDFFKQNNVEIEVHDDKSDKEHAVKNIKTCRVFGARYFAISKNRGKENFWLTHRKFIQGLKSRKFDYVFSLQDDYEYEDNFFSKAVKIFSAIKKHDNRIICLNLQDNRIGQKYWNTKLGKANELLVVNNISAYKVGWVDCVYLANRDFFKMLDFTVKPINKNRWKRNKKKSSGVGQNMSEKITKSRLTVYQLSNPIIKHVGYQSQMGRQS